MGAQNNDMKYFDITTDDFDEVKREIMETEADQITETNIARLLAKTQSKVAAYNADIIARLVDDMLDAEARGLMDDVEQEWNRRNVIARIGPSTIADEDNLCAADPVPHAPLPAAPRKNCLAREDVTRRHSKYCEPTPEARNYVQQQAM